MWLDIRSRVAAKIMNNQADNDDAQAVVNTASLLQISEFDVFKLAYQRWFGHSADNREIDVLFSHYLIKANVPLWVRAFTRQIDRLQTENRLDSQVFGLQPVPMPSHRTALVGAMTLLLMLIFVALLVYLAGKTDPSLTAACRLPPCY
jgi:hypothetical protein